jgi:hypothetical protein
MNMLNLWYFDWVTVPKEVKQYPSPCIVMTVRNVAFHRQEASSRDGDGRDSFSTFQSVSRVLAQALRDQVCRPGLPLQGESAGDSKSSLCCGAPR